MCGRTFLWTDYISYACSQSQKRAKVGKPPPLELIIAHERSVHARKNGSAGSAGRPARVRTAGVVTTDFGDVDVETLRCEGIPWNPFIAEDVELVVQASPARDHVRV